MEEGHFLEPRDPRLQSRWEQVRGVRPGVVGVGLGRGQEMVGSREQEEVLGWEGPGSFPNQVRFFREIELIGYTVV